jgi:hypothetical protein
MQYVITVPNALWGTERLNLGYRGPTMRVRRASDNATKDCYTRADIVSHCTGTNGFVNILYDQSGNARDLQPVSSSSREPKVYDSSTGLLLSGNNLVMSFDGSDDILERADNCNIPTGSPALTSILYVGTWTNTSSAGWSMGPDSPGSSNCWYLGHNASTTIFVSFRFGSRTFNCTDPSSGANYIVSRKAASANATAIDCRQNKSTLTQSAVTADTHVLAIGVTRLGGGPAGSQWAAMTAVVNGHWNAELTGADLDALEQYLERMRVS